MTNEMECVVDVAPDSVRARVMAAYDPLPNNSSDLRPPFALLLDQVATGGVIRSSFVARIMRAPSVFGFVTTVYIDPDGVYVGVQSALDKPRVVRHLLNTFTRFEVLYGGKRLAELPVGSGHRAIIGALGAAVAGCDEDLRMDAEAFVNMMCGIDGGLPLDHVKARIMAHEDVAGHVEALSVRVCPRRGTICEVYVPTGGDADRVCHHLLRHFTRFSVRLYGWITFDDS